MNDPVRHMLEKFGGWWRVAKGWKKLGIASLITIFFSLFLFVALVTLTVWLVKGLTIGGVRNKDLYLPRIGRR